MGREGSRTSELDPVVERFNLSVFRVLFFLVVFITMASDDYFLRWIEVPKAFWFPRSLNLFLGAPPSADLIEALFHLWRWTTVLCMFGFFYRFVAPIWWVSCLIVTLHGHSFGYQGHVFMPVVLAGLPMAFARASESFSFDSWWRNKTGKPQAKDSAFADRMALRTVQLILVLAYFAAGVAKLRYGGIDWLTTDTLRNYLFRSSIVYADTNALAHLFALNDLFIRFPTLCKALAVFAVGVEFFAPLAFLRRRLAYLLVPLIVGLQIGIFFTIYVRFTPYFAILGAWINWHWLWTFTLSVREQSSRRAV